MDAKEAVVAARNHITSENHNLANVQLDLEEVVPDPARRDWRVILSFTPPGGQQGQQSASTSRNYKKVIINDTNGSLVSMMDCTPCAPKCVCKMPTKDACAARQSKQPGRTAPAPMSWLGRVRSLRYGLHSLWRIIFVYASAAAGLVSLIVLYIKVVWGDSSSLSLGEIVIILAALAGMFIGFFAEGIWWLRRSRQPCGNKKKKRWPC